MSDTQKNFHDIALQSSLFKGHSDWYFCYLKSEKIAHVFVVLAEKSASPERFEDIIAASLRVPQEIAYFVAGRSSAPEVLAEIFSLLSAVRLAVTQGYIQKENGLVLVSEYEQIIEKLTLSDRLPSFLSAEDFAVPKLDSPATQFASPKISARTSHELFLKDNKGHTVLKDKNSYQKLQGNRTSLILDFVKQNKGVSIKDVSAVVRDCSEKTIQRELALLVNQGLVKKVGERRWSTYLPTP